MRFLHMLHDKIFPGETQHTYLLIPPWTKVHLGEPMSFIKVTYRNMGEGSLIGAEMTQRQLHGQTHSSMGDSSQSWEPGAHCTACRQLSRSKSVLSGFFGWSKPLPGSLFLFLPGSWCGLRVFFADKFTFTSAFYCLLWQGGA